MRRYIFIYLLKALNAFKWEKLTTVKYGNTVVYKLYVCNQNTHTIIQCT